MKIHPLYATRTAITHVLLTSARGTYRILKAAGIETKGLHSLRHTFATNLVNGQKQPDGSIKSLTQDKLLICSGTQLRKSLRCIM